MKVVVTAKSADRNSEVDPRFGRSPYFHIIDTESGETEIVENSDNVKAMQGAGIQSSQVIVDKKADVLLTGHCGPKAFEVLNKAGIKVVVGVEGKIPEAIEKLKNGEYEYSGSADVEPNW